jgi:beta-lactamase class A
MKKTFILIFIFLFVGMAIGIYFDRTYIPSGFSKDSEEIRLKGYKYISPLLECNDNQNSGNAEYKPSKEEIINLIDNLISNKTITEASVYYRDLNNGPWFGINEKELFTPASLGKLPVMIAFYKWAESDPSILNKKLKFEKDYNPENPYYKGLDSIKKSETYSINELIKRMIVNSDNNALFLLTDNLPGEKLIKVYSDLGIETPKDENDINFISVKNYAALFRVLFNASYLNADLSEKALKILATIDFKNGINKGVPKNISIAHKFGERKIDEDNKQLHDCGIIYYPKHPYLLCIMTRGSDFESLTDFIGKTSRIIYRQIDSKFSGKK